MTSLRGACGHIHADPSVKLRILRDESGNVLLLTALTFSFLLLGVAAMATDVGWVYHQKRIVQTAADDAALAAAVAESTTGADITTAATNAATANGLTVVTSSPTAGQATVSVTDNILGPVSTKKYVQVTVTNVTPTFFMRGFRSKYATISVAASAEASYTVATSSGDGPCMNTNSLTLNSGANIQGTNCTVNDNATSGLSTNSGVIVNVKGFNYHGTTYNHNCGSCSTYNPLPTTGTTTVADPFKSLTAPSKPATSSTNVSTIGSNTTLQPGTYTNTINFNSGTYTVTLQPGLYYFTGGFNINSNVTIAGTGVTLYFASGSNVNINSAATWNLTAPSAALSNCSSCANMLIWEQGSALNLDAASGSSFKGAVYLPNGSLTLNGGSTAAGYGMIYADQVMLNSAISLSCSSMPGGSCPGGTGGGSTNPVAGGVNLGQ
jgi:Flp pilus assembly protein TadG